MTTPTVRRGLVSLIVCLFAVCLGAARAGAEEDKCPKGQTPLTLTYFKAKKKDLPRNGPRCQYNKKGNCINIELQGYLYLPDDTSKPAPILIFNHGSGQSVSRECALGHYFSNQGFIVFIPHRFGHGLSTGTYFGDVCGKENDPGACKMRFLHDQIDDVDLAIKFVKTLTNKDVGRTGKGAGGGMKGADKIGDPDRVAIMGHSFGAIVTQFANTRDLGQKAVIDVAGGSQSWNGNESARDELKDAVAKGLTPTLFFEPMNDQSIEPALVLPTVAGRHCRQFETILFPAIDTDEDDDDKDYKITDDDYKKDPRDTAHVRMMDHTKTYGPATLEFLNRYFTEPAKPFDNLCQNTSSQPQD